MRRTLAPATLLALACTGPTAPSDTSGDLSLTGTIERPLLTAGDTASIVFTLTNHGPEPATLTASFCGASARIVDRRSGATVWPGYGVICTALTTLYTVRPGSPLQFVTQVRAGPPPEAGLGGIRVDPGEYIATLQIDAVEARLRSRPVGFRVR